jgi:hypothetical protein
MPVQPRTATFHRILPGDFSYRIFYIPIQAGEKYRTFGSRAMACRLLNVALTNKNKTNDLLNYGGTCYSSRRGSCTNFFGNPMVEKIWFAKDSPQNTAITLRSMPSLLHVISFTIPVKVKLSSAFLDKNYPAKKNSIINPT